MAAILGSILPKLLLSMYDAKAIRISIFRLYPWKIISKIFLISILILIPFIFIYLYVGHQNFWLSLVWIVLYLIIVSWVQMYNNVFVINYAGLLSLVDKIIRK